VKEGNSWTELKSPNYDGVSRRRRGIKIKGQGRIIK
jgi:hypothetical protein